MTRYAIDEERRALVASWGTGAGDVARTVAQVPGAPSTGLLALADALTHLCGLLWSRYVRPVEPDDAEEQANADSVLAALAKPNLPDGDKLVRSLDPILETAHHIGRVLDAAHRPELTDIVAKEVAAEFAAIDEAELGNLTGRAAQAVLLDRADASPVQIHAADALMAQTIFGSSRLFKEFDPTASAVAVAGWLWVAAEVASQATGLAIEEVLREADQIEPLPVETPSHVLERLEAGETPREVVVALVKEAILAGEGRIPDLTGILTQVIHAQKESARFGEKAERMRAAMMPRRVCLLDPRRPARDLLEDLLEGIHGCWLVYYDTLEAESIADPSDDDEDESDDPVEEARAELMQDVRRAAAGRAERLA